MAPHNQHRHRASGLRQTNKKHKHSFQSKRKIKSGQGGKVASSSVKGGGNSTSSLAAQAKANRRNHAQQIRNAKKQTMLRNRRMSGNNVASSSSNKPPRVVGIVSLSSSSNTCIAERVKTSILDGSDRILTETSTCQYKIHKKDGYLTILTATADNANNDDDTIIWNTLDMARICDCLVFVVSADADGDSNESVSRVADDSSMMTDNASMATNKTQANFDHLISQRGDRILSALRAQGLPTPITLLVHTTNTNNAIDDDHGASLSVKSVRRTRLKQRNEIKKYVSRFAKTEFGSDNDKVLEIELPMASKVDDNMISADDNGTIPPAQQQQAVQQQHTQMLVRTLCQMSCTTAKWVSEVPRPYIIADTIQYSDENQELQLTGYVRGSGTPLDVHSLFHLPNIGTFTCRRIIQQQIPGTHSPHGTKTTLTTPIAAAEAGTAAVVVVEADPALREPLDHYATPDALEGEQNLIGFENDNDDDQEMSQEDGEDQEAAFARPTGWSDYQSAWLDAVDDKDGDEEKEEEKDRGELADELNRKEKKSSSASIAASDGMDMMMDDDDEDANFVSKEERRLLMEERKKQQSEELDFPDEVQVDEDEKARERFARYRSLKSFRKSYWDPKENLPDSFASIYHFSSFKQTQRSVMNEMKDLVRESDAVNGNFFGKSPPKLDVMDEDDDEDADLLEGCVPSGSYITLVLQDVSNEAMNRVSQNSLITAVALLPHENKVSVLHMGLSQSAGCDATDKEFPVKSKDVLTFRCGWRTWHARPVFSQNNLNCDKHKYERFLPTGGSFFAASIFGPVTYTPCPVLVFRERDPTTFGTHRRELVAIGSMLGADADRIVVKRIILTGYPVRVHKRTATVKYMFYDPEDVKWFKPAGLHTKHGLQGHIVQSVGEHGTMKCLFNAPIKQHDTVCLPLYKRIYPKYAPNSGGETSGGATVYRERPNLLVL